MEAELSLDVNDGPLNLFSSPQHTLGLSAPGALDPSLLAAATSAPVSRNSEHVKVATLNFSGADPDWEVRLDALTTHLLSTDPDIVCLQDVAEHQANSVADLLGCAVCTLAEDGQLGLAILSRHSIKSHSFLNLPGPHLPDKSGPPPQVLAAEVSVDGAAWDVLTTQLAWGSSSQAAVRLHQVQIIERWVKDSYRPALFDDTVSPVVLAGSFNCSYRDASMQYLRGELFVDGSTGNWTDPVLDQTDCWSDPVKYATSSSSNPLAASVGNESGGVYPDLLPARRLDYILSRGCTYTRLGSPVETGLWADTHPWCSGSFGVWTTFKQSF